LFPVRYISRLLDLSFWTGLAKDEYTIAILFVIIALHKTEQWQYEQEWRLVFMDDPARLGIKVPMPKPSSALPWAQYRTTR
jgi:hypothetical protein